MHANLLSLLAKHKLTGPVRREISVEPKVLDAKKGIVRYCASDESLDWHGEIVRVNGWRFDYFAKNAPFVNSHDYGDIRQLLGQVVNFSIQGPELIEDVQYALTETGDCLADWAFKMARDGFLKAVSVGFVPVSMCSKWDGDTKDFLAQIAELGLDAATAAKLRAVYREQQQIELSQCILGANPNALAKAYRAGTLTEEDLQKFCAMQDSLEIDNPADHSAPAGTSSARTKLALLAQIQALL